MTRNFFTPFQLSVVIVIISFFYSIESFAQWISLTPVNPVAKGRPVTFILGDTMYYGNGDPYNSNVYGYTTQSNTWYTEPTCPNGGGDQGFHFVINDTAYVGDGSNYGYYDNLWAYTPASGWINISGAHPSATPPGGPRSFTSGFTIGNKGYFGMGLYGNTPYADFYEYDPSTFTWTQKRSLPAARFGGIGFSLNGKGYMGLGYRDQSTHYVYNDIFRYDTATDTWDTLAPLPFPIGLGEAEPAYFLLCNKLIVTLGQTQHGPGSGLGHATLQTWMFDPSDGPKGKWYQLPDFPGYPSYAPGAFGLRDTGYVVGGSDTLTSQGYLQMFKYIPNINTLLVSSNVSICSGTSTTLTADGGGAFKWSPSATLSDSITTSTMASGGLTQVIANPTVTTTYTITEAVCGQTDTVVVTVNNGAPKPDLGNDTSFCGNFSLMLNAGSSGSHYLWSTGDTTSSITVSKTDTFWVEVTSACGTAGDTIVIGGSNAQAGTVTAVRDTICSGTKGNLNLTGNSSGTIQWQFSNLPSGFIDLGGVNGTNYTTNPLSQTTWYRVVVGSNGCVDTSQSFRLYVPPSLTANFTTTNSGSTVTFNSSSSIGNIVSYSWTFGDGTGSTLKNPVHPYTKSDTTYNVCLTVYDGSNCSFTFCENVETGVNGIADIAAQNKWVIYPNPMGDYLLINNKQADKSIESVEVFDVLGRVMMNKVFDRTQDNPLKLDVSNLSQSIYYLKIKTAEADYIQPVVK